MTHRILQCCILNGLVFGLSLFFFNYLLLPLLQLVLGLFLADGGGPVWVYVRPTLTVIFNMLWVLPLFVLSRIINTIWFQVSSAGNLDLRALVFEWNTIGHWCLKGVRSGDGV